MPTDHTYQFRPKDNIEPTDRFLVYDRNNTIRPVTAAAFADLPIRNTPQTGDTILAVDEDGGLFRIEGFSGTRVLNAETYTWSNGVLISVTA